MAYHLHAELIVSFTSSGSTALRVSRNRPSAPILALTPNERAYRQLTIVSGVIPHIGPEISNNDEMVALARSAIEEHGRASCREKSAMTSLAVRIHSNTRENHIDEQHR